jgi:hypothetical protein
LSKRRVLAISSDLDQLRRIVVTLERAGAEVDAVRSSEAIAAEAPMARIAAQTRARVFPRDVRGMGQG